MVLKLCSTEPQGSPAVPMGDVGLQMPQPLGTHALCLSSSGPLWAAPGYPPRMSCPPCPASTSSSLPRVLGGRGSDQSSSQTAAGRTRPRAGDSAGKSVFGFRNARLG